MASGDRRPNMRDVAAAAGVSVITVSRCLRDDPAHSAATRERVRAAAARLGYRPNPLVRALVTQRRRGLGTGGANLVLLNPHNLTPPKHPLFVGVLERAWRTGFAIEVMNFPDGRTSAARMRRVLRARGVSGLLVGPFPEAAGELELDLDGLAAVALSLSVRRPALSLVRNDLFRREWDALEMVARRGYRRALLVLTRDTLERGDHKLGGGLHAYRAYGDPEVEAEELILDGVPRPPELIDLLWQRLASGGHDVVLSPMEPVYDVLRAHSLIVPGQLGFVHLHRREGHRCSGFDQNLHQAGAEAVDLVASLIMNNRFGVPENPVTLVVPSRWVEGDSL